MNSSAKSNNTDALWEKFDSDCHYCRKHEYWEKNCLKKKSDTFTKKQLLNTSASNSNWVTNVTVSCEPEQDSAKRKKKKKVPAANKQKLWLAVHLAEKSLAAVLNSVSDLNFIYKNIAESLISVFKMSSLQHTEGQLLQTYFVYHKKVEVENSFRAQRQTCEPFTSADLKMSLILKLSWLQWNNLKIDFANFTIQLRLVADNNQLFSVLKRDIWDSLTRKLKDLKMNYIVQRLQVIDFDD